MSTRDADDVLPVTWTNVYLATTALTPSALDPLLRLIADDGEVGLTITDSTFAWLYHPYDGGGDVIAPTRQGRDQLRQKHMDWISIRRDGT